MRRILFNEEQKRLIKESLLQQAAMANLPSHLSRDIQSNNTSLSICDTFDGHLGRANLNKLVAKRFEEVKSYFSDDVSNVTPDKVFNKMSKAITLCQKREEPYRDQLEKLCFDMLSETFNFPEDAFNLEFHLVNEINPDKNFNVFPEPSNVEQQTSSEEIQYLDEEIQKRRIIDVLCVGGAMRITSKVLESYISELFKIDEELPHLYSKIMKLNEFYLFLQEIENTDHEHNQAGYAEVVLQTENSPATIKVEGIVFPILLNECIKGILELLASFGLPDDEESASQIVKVADALCFEPWDMRIGPALFDSIFKNIDDLDTNDIPYILPSIVELSPNEFLSLVNECVSGTEKGAEMVQKIAMRGLRDKEYDSFEHDMWSRQNGQEEKPLVTDDEDVIEVLDKYYRK